MTMVAACRYRDGAVIIADSRVTWPGYGMSIFRDVLQKILPFGPKMGIAFAGDVATASLIIYQLRRRVGNDARYRLVRKLAANVPRIARRYYKIHTGRAGPVESVVLVLFGVADNGRVEIYGFQSPHFRSQKLDLGFLVVGSGEVVRPYLTENFVRIEREARDLKAVADSLITGLEGALHGTGIDSVGGLFQCVLVDRDGIRPMRYGFADLDPDAPARAKEMEIKAGKWTQRDLAGGLEVPLVEPAALHLAERKHLRVHDVHEATRQLPRWYLTYFITCVAVDARPGTIEFRGVMTSMAAVQYPLTVGFLAAVGFWGAAGEHEIAFALEHAGARREVKRQRAQVAVFPEEVDSITELTLTIPTPGPAFLEYSIAGQALGRRALYFGKVEGKPQGQDAFVQFAREQVEILGRAHRACTDELIEVTRTAELVYLSLCYECVDDGVILRFDRQIWVVYSNRYPCSLRTFIASAFRLPKGQHDVRIELVDVVTRTATTMASAKIEGSSSCFVTPVHGEVVAFIPKPGWYFVNAMVDDRRVGTVLLAAETEQPKFSYKLADEVLGKVIQGEPFVLLKRSRQEP